MGAHSQVFVRTKGRAKKVAKILEAHGWPSEPRGDWACIDDRMADLHQGEAEALSAEVGGHVVYFMIQTSVDLIVIYDFNKGEMVRAIEYSSDDGWYNDSGRQTSYEDKAALYEWKRERPLASPDGYDVVAAYLGEPGHAPRRPEKIDLPMWVYQELNVEVQRQDRAQGWLLHQALRVARGDRDRWPTDAAAAAAMPETAARPEHDDEATSRYPFKLYNERLAADVAASVKDLQRSGGWVLEHAWAIGGDEVRKFPGVNELHPR